VNTFIVRRNLNYYNTSDTDIRPFARGWHRSVSLSAKMKDNLLILSCDEKQVDRERRRDVSRRVTCSQRTTADWRAPVR